MTDDHHEGWVDPRESVPDFPDRPKTQDFYDLSETVQEMDYLARTLEVEDIIELDANTVDYFIRQRLEIMLEAIGPRLDAPALAAMYLDAFIVGKRFAEKRAALPRNTPDRCEVCATGVWCGNGSCSQWTATPQPE